MVPVDSVIVVAFGLGVFIVGLATIALWARIIIRRDAKRLAKRLFPDDPP